MVHQVNSYTLTRYNESRFVQYYIIIMLIPAPGSSLRKRSVISNQEQEHETLSVPHEDYTKTGGKDARRRNQSYRCSDRLQVCKQNKQSLDRRTICTRAKSSKPVNRLCLKEHQNVKQNSTRKGIITICFCLPLTVAGMRSKLSVIFVTTETLSYRFVGY